MAEFMAYVNGERVPASRAAITIFDRGLRWGDACYDVERSFRHKIFRLREHLARMYRSLRYTRIPQPMSVEEMEKVKDTIQRQLAELDAGSKRAVQRRMQLEWAETTLKAIKEGTAPESFPAEVQLMRIGGEIAFFAVPGELFVEVGMKLKRAMGLPGAFVVAYANGGIGYLPSKRAEEWGWCEHDDSYRLTPHPANFSGGIEDALLKALIRMIGGNT